MLLFALQWLSWKSKNSVVIMVCNHDYYCCWLCLSFDLTLFFLLLVFFNRPFYSCVLSALAFVKKWGWWWPCFVANRPAFHLQIVVFSSYQACEHDHLLMKNKVTASLTPIQRSEHWAHNCKMVYCQRELFTGIKGVTGATQFITGNLDGYTVAHK